MKTRDAVIEYQKTLDDAGTLTKDISLTEPVSAFYLEFQATNGTTSNKGNFLSDVITKIEIVDGAEVLYSVNESELEALHFYKTGKTPVLFPSEWNAGGNRHGVMLMFGRKLWDPEYAMDFMRFKNPQMKITSNLAAVRTIDTTTSFATGTLKATIVAKMMEGAARPNKYLMAKQLNAWTSGTSGDKRVDLPVDRIYRMLMLRAYVAGMDINEVITDLKLTFDTDGFVAFSRKVQQLDAEALAKFGLCELKHDVMASDADTTRLMVNKEPILSVYNWYTPLTLFFNMQWAWSSQAAIAVYNHDGSAYATDVELSVHEQGHALHATLPIPFGDMDDPAQWLDPRGYKKMELVLSEDEAAACSIVAEQVRPL